MHQVFDASDFMGWVSYLHRAATTDYLCCGQALEDSSGAGRIGLTHISFIKEPNSSAGRFLPTFLLCDAKIQ